MVRLRRGQGSKPLFGVGVDFGIVDVDAVFVKKRHGTVGHGAPF